ncbi:uncharacterized protein L203_104554 [Cryptococcus depauperatus CBS 7841]|uniref:Uncharacterized protein n=1 Tax=Cryptococcus depauperatus CBS 7841 TaxID=1295531 RepID=A0AAJ8JVQ6_9TREE
MPARELRKKDAKTPYEALRRVRPTLTRERIWGSRAYVTSERNEEYSCMALAAGWVTPSGVRDGEGLDDPHGAPCFEDRTPTPDLEIPSHIARGDKNEASDEEDSSQADEANYLAVFCP